jgi:hypothetical protein
MANELTGMYCPLCDRQEAGRTHSRLLNKQSGYICSGQGHKFPNYIALMAMKPRMEKLQIQEKQPSGAIVHPMWIHPEALAALQLRFPTNFRTTIYSLFSALANPATLVIEAEHCRELQQLGITKGKEIIGLARTNIMLTEQLKLLTEQMKQYETLSKLMAIAGGGQFNSPAEQGATIAEIIAPSPSEAARPPQAATLPIIDTNSDILYEPVAPGSFSDDSFSSLVTAPAGPRGIPKPTPSGR